MCIERIGSRLNDWKPLTDALSRTLIEEGSAMLLAWRACSSVHNGSRSHLPNTTKSMSLNLEKNSVIHVVFPGNCPLFSAKKECSFDWAYKYENCSNNVLLFREPVFQPGICRPLQAIPEISSHKEWLKFVQVPWKYKKIPGKFLSLNY